MFILPGDPALPHVGFVVGPPKLVEPGAAPISTMREEVRRDLDDPVELKALMEGSWRIRRDPVQDVGQLLQLLFSGLVLLRLRLLSGDISSNRTDD